jgi:hypothetical protein
MSVISAFEICMIKLLEIKSLNVDRKLVLPRVVYIPTENVAIYHDKFLSVAANK